MEVNVANSAVVPDVIKDNSKISKGKYSRNGCTECKKRRMKCDENKPKCWQCARLERECIYIYNPKNKKRKPSSLKTPPNNNSGNKKIKILNSTTIVTSNDGIKPNENEESPIPLSTANETNAEFSFSVHDFNTVYHDLNDLVNWRIEQQLTPNLKIYMENNDNFDAQIPEFQSESNFQQQYQTSTTNLIPKTSENKEIIKYIKLEEFNLGDPHMEYLDLFYHKFSPMVCPFGPSKECNPIRDVLLNYAKIESYLLYALLASGARLKHRESLKHHDDQAFCSYLSECLKILGHNFKDETIVLKKTEPMLLTILLVTSDCGSSQNTKWRAHLRGAKELLKKSSFLKINTDVLNFCKDWLISYELLAGMTNPYGGIFQDDDYEIDSFITNDEDYLASLKKLNMIDENGFNYMAGHLIELDLVFKKIVILLNKIRSNENILEYHFLNYKNFQNLISIDEISEIMSELTILGKKSIIDKSGIIPITNPNHPINNLIDNSLNQSISKVSDDLVLSLSDISNQSHILAGQIIMLNQILQIPKESTVIQELVSKCLNFLTFLKPIDFDYNNLCITHLHMAIVILGKCCILDDDKNLVRRFLKKLGEMGLDSAFYNLKKLESTWKGINEVEEDILTW
ncbi:hypothetical protein WICMUC_004442 [Wickerhamomyces mucosus]|uniref:Zn(2)-C6 fungal-type domain-containing protein n=1 Tax=Wickerhamomyces mucosus TaxID=1378264 RepID=A0A9P8PHX1_9ASCO|nr:hypothetical protein WICMUC_004442 [Wickerhamomyces mucosus]